MFATRINHPGLGLALRARTILVMAIAASLLAGCSSSNDAAKALNPDPPEKMFGDADRALQRGAFADAARKFEDLDRDRLFWRGW